jgi:mono/diheme cytochrome c family protein
MTRTHRFFPIIAVAAGLLAAATVLSSCTRSSEQGTQAPAPSSEGASAAGNLAARGRAVYQSSCIACHNADPKKSGSLGPEVWGASLELLQRRILDAEYPAGYVPKRSTHVMQKMPQVQKDIPALHAYLNGQ